MIMSEGHVFWWSWSGLPFKWILFSVRILYTIFFFFLISGFNAKFKAVLFHFSTFLDTIQ